MLQGEASLDVVERDKEPWLSAIGAEAIGQDRDTEQILVEADQVATDHILQAAMMSDVVEGRVRLRAMVRAYGGMLKAASREWPVRGALSRADLHVLLTRSVLHLLRDVFPAVRADS